MKIKIFYHLFTENYWKDIFQSHLESIVESKLYDSIEVMKVYVIWKEKEDLQKAIDMCHAYKKIKVESNLRAIRTQKFLLMEVLQKNIVQTHNTRRTQIKLV